MAQPDKVSAADITYVSTFAGWLYMVIILDLYTRRVVDWATANHPKAQLATFALRMVLEHRSPSQRVFHYSD